MQRKPQNVLAVVLVASAALTLASATQIEAHPPGPSAYEQMRIIRPDCSSVHIELARAALVRMMETHSRQSRHEPQDCEWIGIEIASKRSHLEACGQSTDVTLSRSDRRRPLRASD